MKTRRFFSLILCIGLMLTLLPSAALAATGEAPAQGWDKPVFSDLPETDALYPVARYLKCQGIMEAFPDGTFQPEAPLTRAQAAKMAVLAKGIAPLAGGDPIFRDVPADHWAFPYIGTAVQAGLLQGYPGDIFGPDQPVTRAEAVTLLLRISGGALSDEKLSIADIPADHWAYRSVVTAEKAGMIALPSDQLFGPDMDFTRGEFARCLSTLFTLGPGLRSAELIGELTVTQGQVTITGGDGNPRTVTAATTVGAGMTVATDGKSLAEISFDDGSGIRMEHDTEISIVRADGFRYMRADGTPAVSVDKLELKLNKGKILGALANRNAGVEETVSQPVPTDETWWLYPFSKRERITVEMPAGIAGIFGTFWGSVVTGGGGSGTTVLEGSAIVSSDGETVPLTGGQGSQVSSPPVPPSPPAPLTPGQMQEFLSGQEWILNSAQQVQNSAPTPPPPVTPGQSPQQQSQPPTTLPDPQTPPAPQQPPTPPNVVSVIQEALQQPGTPPPSGGGSRSGSHGGSNYSAPVIEGPDTIELTVGYDETFTRTYTVTGNPTPTLGVAWGDEEARDEISFTDDTLTVEPGLGSGVYTFELTATNTVSPATKAVTVYVSGPPVIDGPGSILIMSGGESATADYTVSGYPEPSALGIDGGDGEVMGVISLDGSTLTVLSDLAAGSYTFDLTATNTVDTTTKTITVYVIALDLMPLYVDEDSSSYEGITVFGGDSGREYTFSLEGAPPWVDLEDNVITAAPPLGTVSDNWPEETFTFDLVITDEDGNSVNAPFSVTVTRPVS